jgi:hypothetical protein
MWSFAVWPVTTRLESAVQGALLLFSARKWPGQHLQRDFCEISSIHVALFSQLVADVIIARSHQANRFRPLAFEDLTDLRRPVLL